MKNEPPPTVVVKARSYQPNKAELEADVSIDADPDELARAVMRQLVVEETDGVED